MFFSTSFKKKLLRSSLTGTSSLRVTSFLLKRALSLFANNVSLLLFWGISSAFFKSVSNVLYLLISSEAVFIPMPGTPGILSEESPAKDCTSITWLGLTPNFSITSFSPKTLLFMGSYNLISSETNCIKSLSDEITVTLAPALIICFA